MAPRAYWSGHLRLSLVSIAVEMYAGTDRSSTLSLHQIHKPSGKRVRYEKVVPGIGPVDRNEIIKGYEFEKDQYVTLEPDELKEIRLESQKTIDLVQFVGHDEIDPRYYSRPYYLVPKGDISTEGFLVIREALHKAKKIGLGEVAMRGREHLVAVKPCGRGLLLETLRYADEVRGTDAVFKDIGDVKLDKEMIDLAEELIERKTAAFDPAAFEDNYAAALQELIEERLEGKNVVSTDGDTDKRSSAQVIDLMEALKKSVKKDKPAKSSSGARKGGSRRKAG